MKELLSKIKEWFLKNTNKQRFVYFDINSNGMAIIKKLYYYPENNVWKEISSRIVNNFDEKNYFLDKKNALLFQLFFFPFPYKLIVNAPHNYCRSKYFLIRHKRTSWKQPLNEGELALVFSNYLLKILDENKKEVIDKNGFDELNTLLVNHHVVDSALDKDFYYPNVDGMINSLGKELRIGMVHTFLYRPLSGGFNKILPRRAGIWGYFEEGFNAPLGYYLSSKISNQERDKKYVFAQIKNDDTQIFSYDGKSMSFKDTFGFGYRNIYDAINNAYGIQRDSYNDLLQKIEKREMSEDVLIAFLKIIEIELQRLYNGILTFKKDLGSNSVYLDAGLLSGILKSHRKFSPMLVDDGWGVNFEDKDNTLGANNRANLFYGGIPKNTQLNTLSAKHIRWLIPYNINS